MDRDDSFSPFKVPAVPGAPLYPTSPERMNQNRLPPSPAVAAVLTNCENHHRRQTSEVQSKVAFLNSLSRPGTPSTPVLQPQTNAQSTSSALQRALLGREEAESAVSFVNTQLTEAQARERKISERVESLIEDLQAAKERQAHERQVFEKEVRKARKDAFRAGSALVKLQEDLKEARTENSTLRKDVQKEKEAKELAKQEAFERAYVLSGQAEELEVLKEQLRSVEAERDAARLEQKAEEMAESERSAEEPKEAVEIPDRPCRGDRSEEQYINETMSWIKGIARGNEPEEIHELKSEISSLQFQLNGANHKIEEQKKDLAFQLLLCQGKLCPCRRAEKRGEYYIYDQAKHDRRMKEPTFAQQYHEEMERLKPAREAWQAEEARMQAEWEAEAPARAERQKKWLETQRRNLERLQGIRLGKIPASMNRPRSEHQPAPNVEPAGKPTTTDTHSGSAQTDVTFSPTSGTFQKVDLFSALVSQNQQNSDSASRNRRSGRGSLGAESFQMRETDIETSKDQLSQPSLRTESEHLEGHDVNGNSECKDVGEVAENEDLALSPEKPPTVSSLRGQAIQQEPDTEQDPRVEDAKEDMLMHTLPRPLSALTTNGDSPVRHGANSPALSASSSGPAPAPPDEVLFSDDEDEIVTSARASDAHLASEPVFQRVSSSSTQTPVRPHSQNSGAITNITTTTTIPLRGHDNAVEASSPVQRTPGTPISREAALAQIRARRDRARSVVLKEAKSAPGTPANARRGLIGGLSVLRSAGPGKSVDKAREFSAHSNAF